MSTISISAEARSAALGKHAGAPVIHMGPESGGERMLLGLLVLAAMAAIGYGFFWLLDLVQSCALVGAGVGHLVQ